MPLFTFARLNPNDVIDVTAAITAAGRSLERKFPECTIQIVDSGDYGMPSQWVRVDLDFTAATLTCLEWYATELASKGVALQSHVKGSLEPARSEPNDFDLLLTHMFDRRLARG